MTLQDIIDTVTIGYSPVIDKWPLMSNPIPVAIILISYLFYVLKYGPNHMKNRKAFNLKWLIILYNFYQVVFSIWLCISVSLLRSNKQKKNKNQIQHL